MKKETDTEIPAQEETPTKETKEESKGGKIKVPLSEEFQKNAMEMAKGMKTRDETKFMHDQLYAREDELRKQEEPDEPTMDDYKSVIGD